MDEQTLPANFSVDVLVIGGGPAGATAATILSERGCSVLVLEATQFPRLAVGELIAATSIWRVWHRLGLDESTLDPLFLRKYGGVFESPNGARFEFNQNVHPDDPVCRPFVYNLERSKYDELLLNRASDRGAGVIQKAWVRDIRRDPGGRVCGVTFEHQGRDFEVEAKFLIDASGRAGVIARHLGLRKELRRTTSICAFAHFEGAQRECGKAEGVARVAFRKDMWYWWAPLSDSKVSVGIVANKLVYGPQYSESPERFFDQHVRSFEFLRDRLGTAQRVTPFRPISKGNGQSALDDYHSVTTQRFGNGWAVVGDAGGFVDPIFAAGLLIAQSSAIWLADEIADSLSQGDTSLRPLKNYAKKYHAEFDSLTNNIETFASHYFDDRFVDFFVMMGNRFPALGRLYVDTLIANKKTVMSRFSGTVKQLMKVRGSAIALIGPAKSLAKAS